MAQIIIPVMLDTEELEEYMYDALLQETLERRMRDTHSRKVEIDRKKRAAKMARKIAADNVEYLDNGHYFVNNVNKRGAMNIAIVDRKANRKRKRNFYSYEDYLRDEMEKKIPCWWDMMTAEAKAEVEDAWIDYMIEEGMI